MNKKLNLTYKEFWKLVCVAKLNKLFYNKARKEEFCKNFSDLEKNIDRNNF